MKCAEEKVRDQTRESELMQDSDRLRTEINNPSPSTTSEINSVADDFISALAKCQVDTPPPIVRGFWEKIDSYRKNIGSVFDGGAGDGRFSKFGKFEQYVGYEIDPSRMRGTSLSSTVSLIQACAFSAAVPNSFDIAIGNPPYVRHHDLEDDWRNRIASQIHALTGVRPDGRSNAYLYFIWLALIVTRKDGLVALLVPFDWATRPAAADLREYIRSRGWSVDIYRLDKEPFLGVMTTACCTVIDKSVFRSQPHFYRVGGDWSIEPLFSPTLTKCPPLEYLNAGKSAYARRGLSPGHQEVFLLNETNRKAYGLRIGRDVVPAVSTLRKIPTNVKNLTKLAFQKNFVDADIPCWLIRFSNSPSKDLTFYLKISGDICKTNGTCSNRLVWWRYKKPKISSILYASGFRGPRPKYMRNTIGAVAVGTVCGIYTESDSSTNKILRELAIYNFSERVVALSRGFTKVEINQMNTFIQSMA